jgi:hypothetical protein
MVSCGWRPGRDGCSTGHAALDVFKCDSPASDYRGIQSSHRVPVRGRGGMMGWIRRDVHDACAWHARRPAFLVLAVAGL